MEDRLRELIDVVIASLDEPADGATLARRAHFSRDHLDRLLAAATGESPVALRRRLLLERAAWQLRTGALSPSEAAEGAGYGSLAAFSRAFARAYGTPPSAFDGEIQLEAPNGIHFHPPAGLLIPGTREPVARRDLTDRMVSHHLDRVRELLAAAATLDARGAGSARCGPASSPSGSRARRRARPRWPSGWSTRSRSGSRRSTASRCRPPRAGRSSPRFERAALGFERLAKRIRDRGAFDDAFVDALCEPPQSFTYGGVLSHVLTFGAIRREALASVLAELGADVPDDQRSDPLGAGSELADPDGPERDDVLSAAVRLQADVAAAPA